MPTETKAFKCNFCNKVFNNRLDAESHEQNECTKNKSCCLCYFYGHVKIKDELHVNNTPLCVENPASIQTRFESEIVVNCKLFKPNK